METLLIFLAIIAIQMIAAYTKQKKEAEKKAARQSEKPYEPSYEETFDEDPQPQLALRHEVPPEPIRQPLEPTKPAYASVHVNAININNPAQGILWAAILQEPRFKKKWKIR
jgi:hypothetical protein